MGLPLKPFPLIRLILRLKNSIFFYSTPKEILNLYNLPLENSMVPQAGAGEEGVADIINNCSSSLNGFWVNSP